jgi:hypothetical protein
MMENGSMISSMVRVLLPPKMGNLEMGFGKMVKEHNG